MIVTVSNEIRIQDPSPDLLGWIRKELNIPNPEYTKKLRMGLWTGNTPPQICLYRIDGGSVCVPCGVGKTVGKYLTEGDRVIQDLAHNGIIRYPGTIPLYDYQEMAVKAMERVSCGILQSPCGSGKTQMGLALAAGTRRKTLWVTHTQDLLNQSYSRAVQYFPESILGKITGGKVHIGSHITFATVQTLSKLDLSMYKYAWDVVIVDECHRLAGTPAAVTMFYRPLSHLAARNKYGLSATVHRSDGLIKSTFAVIGPVAYHVPDEAVADKTMQVSVKRINTGIKPDIRCLDTDGTMEYGKLIAYLTENYERNKKIADLIVENKEHSNLVLSDRLEHLRTLLDMVPEDVRKYCVMIDGKMTSRKAKTAREQAIEDMRTGKKRVLFATYSLAKEGLDIPVLDRLYLTTPKKDYAVVTQSIGRIARKHCGKGDAVCYDFVDSIGFCENQYRKRKTSYRKAGCKISE